MKELYVILTYLFTSDGRIDYAKIHQNLAYTQKEVIEFISRSKKNSITDVYSIQCQEDRKPRCILVRLPEYPGLPIEKYVP